MTRRVERGMVTAEVAVAIPSLVLLLAVVLAAVDLGVSQVRCVDAARTGARLLARAEPAAEATSQIRAAAPRAAVVIVDSSGGLVRVRVSAPAPAGLARIGIHGGPSAEAVALLEVP